METRSILQGRRYRGGCNTPPPPIILSYKSWSKWLNSWSLQSLEQDTLHVQQNLKF